MKTVYRNDELLELAKGSYLIHDSSITRFDIFYEKHQLHIDVYFNSFFSGMQNSRKLKIRFSDVIKYQFSYSKDHNFYDVESHKFSKSYDQYYISFDPAGESELMHEHDQDFILCNNIEGYFL